MREYQRLIQLAGNVYDAALDATHWPQVLANIACFAGGQACLLSVKNSTDQSDAAYHQFGIDECYLRLYRDSFDELNPSTASPAREPGRIAAISELASFAEFRRTGFYRDWLRPQGFVEALSVQIENVGTGYACLSVLLAESDLHAGDEIRRRMKLIVPHLRRALAVETAIESRQTEAATFADILDNLNAGIFLVDADGAILHTNAAGNAIQRAGEFLRAVRGRLTACDGHADLTLRAIFAAAADGAVDRKGIALPLTAANGEHYVAQVLPLAGGEKRRHGSKTAVAALFVRKAEMDASSPVDVIGKAYNLTPTELRVLLAIVDIGGVPEVAQNLGVADTTIKTHLSRLFEKTGAGRQADLVKLVAGFSNPLIGSSA